MIQQTHSPHDKLLILHPCPTVHKIYITTNLNIKVNNIPQTKSSTESMLSSLPSEGFQDVIKRNIKKKFWVLTIYRKKQKEKRLEMEEVTNLRYNIL